MAGRSSAGLMLPDDKQKPARPKPSGSLMSVSFDQAARALMDMCRMPFSIAFCPRFSAGPKGR